MVGIVIVSHSEALAESTAEMAGLMAKGVVVKAAGGTDNSGFGTSYEKILSAVNEAYSDDGVIIFADLGSSIMTSKMIIEMLSDEGKKIVLADAPLVEGSIAAATTASCGLSLEQVLQEVELSKQIKKA